MQMCLATEQGFTELVANNAQRELTMVPIYIAINNKGAEKL